MRIFTPLPKWSWHKTPDLSAHFIDEIMQISKYCKRVYILCERERNEMPLEKVGNVEIHKVAPVHIPKLRGFHKILLYLLNLIVISRKVDVIYIRTFGLPDLLVSIFARNILRKPVVHVIPGTWIFEPPTLKNMLLRFFFKLAIIKSNLVILYSWRMYNPILKYTPLNKAKVKIIHNAINPNRFKKVEANDLKSRLGIKEDEKVVLYVGRISQAKGLIYLIKAIPKIISKNINCRFVLVGNHLHLKFKKELFKLARELKVKDRIIFTGPIHNESLPKYYSIADVFVMPSLSEGISRSILEAFSCEVPVVATEVAGIPDVVIPNKTGFLIKPGDINMLALAISKLLKNEELRKRLGSNGRKIILSEFSWERVVPELINTLRSILV